MTTWAAAGGTIGNKEPPKRVARQINFFITALRED
jgi:hypothetical protein